MTDPNEPAFSRPVSKLSEGEISVDQDGLTKREYFAAMAMQGILANKYAATIQDTVTVAANVADALIAELNKPVGDVGKS